MTGSSSAKKRARPEDGDDHHPPKKQDTKSADIPQDDSVKQKDMSQNDTSDLDLSPVNHAPMLSDTDNEQHAIKTEPDQFTHAASTPNSPAHNNPLTHPPTRRISAPLNSVSQLHPHTSPTNMYPMPGEGMLDYCLRRHYLPANHHLSWSSSTAAALRPFLALTPVRKIDQPRPWSFLVLWQPPPPNDSSNANYYALFTQVGGRVALQPCTRCAGGGARWTPCVAPPTEETAAVVGGACGRCLYNDLGSTCSFARADRPPVESRAADRPVPESMAVIGAQTPYPQQHYSGEQLEYSQRTQLQQQAQRALPTNAAWAPSARSYPFYASATIPQARQQQELETERSEIEKELHRIADEQLWLATRQKELLKRMEELG
ncbi:hypothetical protein GE09DRAFT_1264154 [Coniochaeta sp. 2T2.1]|nr:hypothetical protein GE09DRAFT_1264154 [Coniochaeta sp. 2T2.1]